MSDSSFRKKNDGLADNDSFINIDTSRYANLVKPPKFTTLDDYTRKFNGENNNGLIGTSFNTVGNAAGDAANKSIMDLVNNGASAETIAAAGKIATDSGLYDNDYIKSLGKQDQDGLGDGMLSSVFGKDGYLGSLNKDLEGIGGFEGLGKGIGLGLDVMGIMNQRKGAKLAKQAWEAENARANEIMAMNREKYDTFKKDKAALNASYSGAK